MLQRYRYFPVQAVLALADLDRQSTFLPAVLQSSDTVALIDHLNGVLREADWQSTARQV